MAKINYKKISCENLFECDQVMSAFRILLPNGKNRVITLKEWFNKIFQKKLNDSIPIVVSEQIEITRNIMVYGYFFYPIFTFASEQLTRIAENAINIRCNSLQCPKSKKTFKEKIEWLHKNSLLSKESYLKWESIIKLRNKFSHPEKQSIITPFMGIELINNIVEEINNLYTIKLS